jgi:hypothetical protein
MKKYFLVVAVILVIVITSCRSGTSTNNISTNSSKFTIKCSMKQNSDIYNLKKWDIDYLKKIGLKKSIEDNKLPASFLPSDDIFYFNYDEEYVNINAEKWIIDTIIYQSGTKTLVLIQEGNMIPTRMLGIADVGEDMALITLSKCKFYGGANGNIDWDGNVTVYLGNINDNSQTNKVQQEEDTSVEVQTNAAQRIPKLTGELFVGKWKQISTTDKTATTIDTDIWTLKKYENAENTYIFINSLNMYDLFVFNGQNKLSLIKGPNGIMETLSYNENTDELILDKNMFGTKTIEIYKKISSLQLPNQSQNNPRQEDSNNNTQQSTSSFIVVADKAYFHNQPNDESIREAYLEQGERVSYTSENNGYLYVVYTNNSGQTTRGWINKNDVEIISDN